MSSAESSNMCFASRCKKIHGWYGLDGQYHIAYLCEANLYVDTGGTLTDITPTGGITPPSGLVGGFGDGLYDVGYLRYATFDSWQRRHHQSP